MLRPSDSGGEPDTHTNSITDYKDYDGSVAISDVTFTQTEGQENIQVSIAIANNLASDSIEVTSLTITPANCMPITIENIGYITAGSTTYANAYVTDTGVMTATDYTIDNITYTEEQMPMPVIVSFETIAVPNGENAGTPEQQTVNTGDYASRPDPDPTNEGYVLENWYDNYDDVNGYGNVFDFATTPIESDITIYAKWEPNA